MNNDKQKIFVDTHYKIYQIAAIFSFEIIQRNPLGSRSNQPYVIDFHSSHFPKSDNKKFFAHMLLLDQFILLSHETSGIDFLHEQLTCFNYHRTCFEIYFER